MPKQVKPMHDNNRHLEILQALAAGTDPITGEVFPADSPYNQPEIIRANSKPLPKKETRVYREMNRKMNCWQNALAMMPRLQSLQDANQGLMKL